MNPIASYLFFKKLTDLSYVEEIWLCGSRARGDNQERSDIDLVILCPIATDSEWLDIIGIINDADTLLKIDCIRFDKLKKSLLKDNILKDKKILYQKEKNE